MQLNDYQIFQPFSRTSFDSIAGVLVVEISIVVYFCILCENAMLFLSVSGYLICAM